MRLIVRAPIDFDVPSVPTLTSAPFLVTAENERFVCGDDSGLCAAPVIKTSVRRVLLFRPLLLRN